MTQIRVCILLLQGYKNRYTYFFLFVYLIQKMSVCILRFILVSGLWASPKSICSLGYAVISIFYHVCMVIHVDMGYHANMVNHVDSTKHTYRTRIIRMNEYAVFSLHFQRVLTNKEVGPTLMMQTIEVG